MSPRTAAKPRRKRRRQVSAGKATPDKIVLTGNPARAVQVERALRALDIQLVLGTDITSSIDRNTVAVVLVTPLVGTMSAAEGVSSLRESRGGAKIPVFAVVGDGTSDREVRRIYSRGGTAVLYFPGEALLMAPLIAELLGIASVRGRPKKVATALTRTLKAHLRLVPWSTSGVRVRALAGGEVLLSGSVATLWRKRELERMLMRVPGVKRIVANDLWVDRSGLSDRQITRAARAVLRSTTHVDEATISVTIQNGTAILAGTVARRTELARIVDLMAQVRGVREIDNSLVVSSIAKSHDGRVARKLNGLLSKWFPTERVDVSVFAQVAVLSGTASSLSRRTEVESFIDQDPRVQRVINKLEIA